MDKKGRKRIIAEGGACEANKKQRGENWNQRDTNLLCNLLVKFGVHGILNKETNGATNDIKRREWDTIRSHFNADPTIKTQRETDALIGRHKKIMTASRHYTAAARQNAMQTGGGPANTPPALKIDVTGEVLQLKRFYGHLLSGLEPFDSDTMPLCHEELPTLTDSTAVVTEKPTNVGIAVVPNRTPDPERVTVPLPLPETVSPTETTIELPLSESVITATKGTNISTSSENLQFFPTNGQRHRQLRNQKKSSPDNVAEMRQQMIKEERDRLAEFHELRMNSFRLEHEERILEVQQRREMQNALASKQMQFWEAAIKTLPNSHQKGANTRRDANSEEKRLVEIGTLCDIAINLNKDDALCNEYYSEGGIGGISEQHSDSFNRFV